MKTFQITSGEWIDEIDIDETIFETYESQAQEAISQSLEKWLDIEQDKMIGIFAEAKVIGEKDPYNGWVMNNYYVFENIGRHDMMEVLKDQCL